GYDRLKTGGWDTATRALHRSQRGAPPPGQRRHSGGHARRDVRQPAYHAGHVCRSRWETAAMSPVVHPLPAIPWGLMIGVCFILAGVAAGTTLVAEWVAPQDDRRAVVFAWRTNWVALGVLILCGV